MAAITWAAGPIAYRLSYSMHPIVSFANWEFIGGADDGTIRRWNLRFDLKERRFSRTDLAVSDWDKAHAQGLCDFFRPNAVLLSMVTGRNLTEKLRHMISENDIAEVMALSIQGGHKL